MGEVEVTDRTGSNVAIAGHARILNEIIQQLAHRGTDSENFISCHLRMGRNNFTKQLSITNTEVSLQSTLFSNNLDSRL